MMKTPPLRGRMVAGGVLVIVVVLTLVALPVYAIVAEAHTSGALSRHVLVVEVSGIALGALLAAAWTTHLANAATRAHDDLVDQMDVALSEARAAASRSRHMEERSKGIIETATDAFISVDLRGAIVDWNKGAERVFGWTAEEVVGRDCFDTVFPAELRDTHRARLDMLRSSGERRALGRRLDTLATRKDGRTFSAELVLWATGEGTDITINAFVHDVSARQRAEETHDRLAAIVESSNDAIIGMTLDGVVTSWNPAAERIYGYDSASMLGARVTRIVLSERHDQVARYLEMVAKGQPVPTFETLHVPRGGTPVVVAVTLSPICNASGAVTGASMVALDLTEHRWLAATLDSTLSALESALGDARASDARGRRFLADAAHQLRTPVAGIRACAETLLRGVTPAESDRLLADMIRETSRVSRLMALLLQSARLDQGHTPMPTRCDIAALCRDEAERARLLSPDLDVSVSGDTSEGRYLDPNAAREVVANLLDNARRHASQRVLVEVESRRDSVEVRVLDDGPGVPAGMEDRVFERFVSLDGRGGSGLGLAIARGIARAHGGDVSYTDRAFVLWLPTHALAADGAVPGREE
jgi:PAS domain S-box-containing protein